MDTTRDAPFPIPTATVQYTFELNFTFLSLEPHKVRQVHAGIAYLCLKRTNSPPLLTQFRCSNDVQVQNGNNKFAKSFKEDAAAAYPANSIKMCSRKSVPKKNLSNKVVQCSPYPIHSAVVPISSARHQIKVFEISSWAKSGIAAVLTQPVVIRLIDLSTILISMARLVAWPGAWRTRK